MARGGLCIAFRELPSFGFGRPSFPHGSKTHPVPGAAEWRGALRARDAAAHRTYPPTHSRGDARRTAPRDAGNPREGPRGVEEHRAGGPHGLRGALRSAARHVPAAPDPVLHATVRAARSEEHTSELQ